MNKQQLTIAEKAVAIYLSRDKNRAKRIIEAAYPRHNLSRNPTRRKIQQEGV